MLDPRKIAALTQLSERLGISFSNQELLHQALTHTSYANESKKGQHTNNERLEFLGDAILDAVITAYLFRRFPRMPEGELTKARANVVCEPALASCAVKVELGQHLLLGRGERSSGGRERASILADAFEAIIGAVYLDAGFEATSEFVIRIFQDQLHDIGSGHYYHDFKTILQETVQRNGEGKVQYEIIAVQGPDHDKLFEVVVLVNSLKMGQGAGKTKKEAEQNAARQALESFQPAGCSVQQ